MLNLEIEYLQKIADHFKGNYNVRETAYDIDISNGFHWFTLLRESLKDGIHHDLIYNGRGGSTWDVVHIDTINSFDLFIVKLEKLREYVLNK